MLYLCLVPNRGARIGHQTDDHFKLVAYCDKNGFIFVYHPFIGNSSKFEDGLRFSEIYENNYSNTLNKMDKIINIKYLIDNSSNLVHEQLIELHKSTEKIMIFDNICGNENFYKNYNINWSDIIEIKKTYKCVLNYTSYVNQSYICIHIRCGNIVNNPSRYLGVEYFIDKYNYLISLYPELIEMPVYIITEQNFKDNNLLYEKIKNCNIVQTDEISSFYYLVNCKYLIASRSGFSNLAYILGNMKVIKAPFDWNCYWDNLIE
jgi:hypothetical protein